MARNFVEKQVFFGLSNFFRHLYEVLDPKCYTWLESLVTKDSHGKLLDFFKFTSKGTEFC